MSGAERTWSRREALALAAASVVAIGVGAPALAADPAPCFDPAKLPASQKSRRRSIGFQLKAPDPKKTCGGCVFYTAAAAAGCGTCALLSGGPVAAQSVCNSWAKKP